MVRVAAVLIAASILLGSAQTRAEPSLTEAGTGSSCLSWKTAVLAARASDPRARVVDVMDGQTASAFLAYVNAIPPISHVGGDHVAVVFVPPADMFLFIIGEEECATGVVQVPRNEVQKMVGVSA